MSNVSAQSVSEIPENQDLVRTGIFEENQLGVLIQEQELCETLLLAFNDGPESYCYFEGGGDVTVVIWSFCFSRLPGLCEVNFDIQRTSPADNDALLNNRLHQSIRFYLRMAGQLVDAITLEIDPKAWALFLTSLRTQQVIDYRKEDYDRALEIIYNYT